MKRLLGLTTAALIALAAQAEHKGWRIDGTGVVKDATPVMEWSKTKNVIWKTKLNDWSNATPLLSNGNIIICEEKSTVVCVDAAKGKVKWRKNIKVKLPGKEPKTHKVNGFSSPSPITDGKYIYVTFSLGTAAALDFDGNIVWSKHIAAPTDKWGFCSSPVLAGGKLLLHINKTLYALDPSSGKKHWEVEAASKWGTDIAVKIGAHDAVYTTGGDLINVADGSIIAQKVAPLPWSSPIEHDGIVYIVDQNEATAVQLPKSLSSKPKRLWTTKFSKPNKDRFYSSPILHDGLLYNINRSSNLVVLEAKTGKIVYEHKLPFPKQTLYPSPVLAGGKLFISHDTGKTIVIEPGRTFKQLALNELEPFRSIPLFENKFIFIRTLDNLFCIGDK